MIRFTKAPKQVFILLFLAQILLSMNSLPQNYQLVWEDQFDGNSLDSTKWNTENNVGIWNTGGNSEFQHYKSENVTVGDDGKGNNCLIITAKEEQFGGYHYTSGRVNTRGKFAFRRGKLEASIKIPDLANGLWPAFWTLGYTPVGWPDCGEIDVLEMGHAEGIRQGKVNSFIGSHLFWGPYPRDYGKEYITSYDLSTDFFKHTVIWDEKNISVYFNDSPTPYFSMGIDGADTEEYRNFQHYVIFNLAVGGSVPGIYNRNEITANFPASMYVDWVKVYQQTEDFATEDLPIYGNYGIFQDASPVDMTLNYDFDLLSQTHGLSKKPNETAFAGNNVLAYNVEANQAFEIKLSSVLARNMQNYDKGSVQFFLKTNIEGNISIGIADKNGNEAFVAVDDKFARDGNWHALFIPIESIKDKVDITALSELLVVKGNSSNAGYIAIDEAYFSQTIPVSGIYGIYTNNPAIDNKFIVDNVTGHLYNWDGTVTFNKAFPAYEGEDVLSFRSSGAAGWWGFGLFSTTPQNLSKFSDGYLNFMLRTKATQTFTVAVQGANNTQGAIEFKNNSDPYGFVRDGIWHRISVPVSELIAKGLDLSASGNVFTMSGSTIGDIAVDDIYFSENAGTIENGNICYPIALSVSPKNRTIKQNTSLQFTVSANDQFGNPTDAYVEWNTDGGNISETGLFMSADVGIFNVWASLYQLADTTTVIVERTNTVENFEIFNVEINYRPQNQLLVVSKLEPSYLVSVVDHSGKVIYKTTGSAESLNIDLSNYALSIYIVTVKTPMKVFTKKIAHY